MRYVRLVGILGLALICGLGTLIVTSNDSLESFDPYHPGTILPIVANRLRVLRAQVRELRLRELIDGATAAFRDRVRHESATHPTPQ